MNAAQPDRTLSDAAGQPLRFLAMVLLLWGCARALMGTTILNRGLDAMAEPVNAVMTSAIAVPSHVLAPARRSRGTSELTAPIEAAPKLGHYYGRIADISTLRPSRRLEDVPIVPGPDPRSANGNYAAVAKAGSWNSSAPIFNMIPVPTAMTSPRAAVPRVSAPPVGNEAVWAEKEKRNEDRFSGSAWIFWRDRPGARSLGSAGQLGGAQAGVRVDGRLVNLARGIPLSAYGRISTALHRPAMPEAALGLAIRPIGGPVPLTLGVERRFALDNSGGRDAFALVAITGLYPTHIGPLIAEGYAQAGMVGFSQRDAFVDGRFSLAFPLDRTERFRIGGSVSGGAQPGLSRLDAGPVLEMRVPVGGISPRLLVEWRQRVAGRAAPGSGLSVTLGTDF